MAQVDDGQTEISLMMEVMEMMMMDGTESWAAPLCARGPVLCMRGLARVLPCCRVAAVPCCPWEFVLGRV